MLLKPRIVDYFRGSTNSLTFEHSKRIQMCFLDEFRFSVYFCVKAKIVNDTLMMIHLTAILAQV